MKKLLSSILALALLASTVACSTDQVFADINVLTQIAVSIGAAVGTVDTKDAAEVAKLSKIAEDGVAAVQADYATYKTSRAHDDLQKLQAALKAVQSNLTQELQAAQISNPNSVLKVTNWVALIVTSLDAVLAALPQLTANAAPMSAKLKVAASLPTDKTLAARWNSEVCAGDARCGKLVHAKKHFLGF